MRTKGTATEYRNSRKRTTELVQTILQQRLCKLGSIQLKEAWEMCRRQIISMSVLQPIFKDIMMKMVEENKADIIRPGVYWIYKK